jgi:predicted lipase
MTKLRHDIALDMIHFIEENYNEVNKSADIIVNSEKQYICAVFRGSIEALDWRRNCQFCQHKIKGKIAIHTGFCKQLFASNLFVHVYSKLYYLLEKNPTYELFITGHSSGGAIATLFGYLIAPEITERQIQIVSFASPRVGNLAFKQEFNKRTNLKHWRIKNQYDFIPRIPYFGFHHVGEQIFIRKNSCIFCCKEFCNHMSKSYYKSLLDSGGEFVQL